MLRLFDASRLMAMPFDVSLFEMFEGFARLKVLKVRTERSNICEANIKHEQSEYRHNTI
jgi:hypothetical protein